MVVSPQQLFSDQILLTLALIDKYSQMCYIKDSKLTLSFFIGKEAVMADTATTTPLGGVKAGAKWLIGAMLCICCLMMAANYLPGIWKETSEFFETSESPNQQIQKTSEKTPEVLFVGSSSKPTSTKVKLDNEEWSSPIELQPGLFQYIQIVPPPDGQVEILDPDRDRTFLLKWSDLQSGRILELGSLTTFQLRGEGAATVRTLLSP